MKVPRRQRNARNARLACAALGAVVVGSGTAGSPWVSAAIGAASSRPRVQVPAAPHHRIAVRRQHGRRVLYDTKLRRAFVLRGVNYVRLAPETRVDGSVFEYHSTFDVGRYDHVRTVRAFRAMHALGLNTVRVFLDGVCRETCLGDPAGGLSPRYVANVDDVLRAASRFGLFVILTTDNAPSVGGYRDSLTADGQPVEGLNLNYLTQSGIDANARAWSDLIVMLRTMRAPLDVVLAYELRNELTYRTSAAPLSLSTGTVTEPNGMTYDLSHADERRRMLDDAVVMWVDHVRQAIRAVDPTALVSVGLAQPTTASLPVDPVPRRAIATRSAADIIDLHFYPNIGGTLADYMTSLGRLNPHAVLIMGELGAPRSAAREARDAPTIVHDLVAASCRFGFRGWLLWTWDTTEQPGFWTSVETAGRLAHAVSGRCVN